MKHMAGNMISRWTDFLTTDGEKPERDRDLEFEMLPGTTKDEMVAYWEKGWTCVFEAVEPLKPDDLMRTVTIRGQEAKSATETQRKGRSELIRNTNNPDPCPDFIFLCVSVALWLTSFSAAC